MIRRRFFSVGLFLVLVLFLSFWKVSRADGHSRAGSTPNGILLNVVPSRLSEKVHAFAMRRPDLPGPIVAAMGNARIDREGVDYDFDLQNFIKEKDLKPLAGGNSDFAQFRLPMETVEGEPVRLDVEATAAQMCGERIVRIPLAKLTATEIDVVIKGKQYRLKRPKSFGLEGMSLVDASFKNQLRTWELPFVTQPRGISADGKEVYFEPAHSYSKSELEGDAEIWPEAPPLWVNPTGKPAELLLAVSRGVYRFADASEVPAKERFELIEMPSPYPDDAYAMFKRFLLGGQTFIVRFEGPCT